MTAGVPDGTTTATPHVHDAGRALVAALTITSGVYNVVRDGERVSNTRFRRAAGWTSRPWHPDAVALENVEVVDLQIVVGASGSAVWDAFVNEEDRSRWWSYLRLEAHPGGQLMERWRDPSGQERTTSGLVLEVEAPHRLRCTWRDDDWPQSTDVELTFRPTDGVTGVRIRHSGWERLGVLGPELRSAHVRGWQVHLANLKRFLERSGS